MKKFDHNNDGVISMEEFYETLANCMWMCGPLRHLSDNQPA
jgi:Ca2+-binding EF-hand superfamily protein